MDLQADSIQGVLFPTPGHHQDDALKLWGHLFPGDSPDAFQRAINTPALNSSASGERSGLQIALTAQVGRVDVILTQPATQSPTNDGPPRIVDVAAAVNRTGEILKRLSATMPVARIAVVVNLAKSVTPGSESEELATLLPGFAFPPNVSDLSLQFNSRKKFDQIENAEMNRLIAWNSGQIGFILASPMQAPNMLMMTPYIGVKIDVNSAPELQLKVADLIAAIDEIVAESLIVMESGAKRFEQ